jgi:hypothetical protein
MAVPLEKLFRLGHLVRDRHGRVRINYKGNWMSYHHLVWKLVYPDDPIAPDEDIHHWDHNNGNNSPLNLVKMKMVEHREMHRTKTVRAFIHPIEIKRRKRHMGDGQARLICRADAKFNQFEAMEWR